MSLALTRRFALIAGLLPFLCPAEATPMQVRRGARRFDAVRVVDPIDPIAISLAMPGVALQLTGGAVEVASGTSRCFANPGQWIVLDRTTGALRAVEDAVFAAQHEQG